MKLTEKLPSTTFPQKPGVYITQRGDWGQKFWRAFDGEKWHFGTNAGVLPSPPYEHARNKSTLPEDMMNFTWQGLAEKPE